MQEGEKSMYVCTTYIVYAHCIQCRKSLLRYLPHILSTFQSHAHSQNIKQACSEEFKKMNL